MFLLIIPLHAQQNYILSVSPSQNFIGSPKNTSLEIKFESLIDINSIYDRTFKVHGLNSGIHKGTVTYDINSNILKFQPERLFSAGEKVKVTAGPFLSSFYDTIKAFNWEFTVGITNKTNAKFNTIITSINSEYIHAIDFDMDGNIDLITQEGYVAYNQGNGFFSEPIYVPILSNVTFICDINNDNYPDLIKQYEELSLIYIDDQSGGYKLLAAFSGQYSFILNYGDLNNNGLIDLITNGPNGWNIVWNKGNGIFERDNKYYIPAIASFGIQCKVADIDNDGDLDVIMLMENGIKIFYNDGDGNFTNNDEYFTEWQEFLDTIEMNDFNNDNYLDAAVNGITNGGVVLFNQKNGGFQAAQGDTGIFSHLESPILFSSGDMNGDNRIDIVLTNHYLFGLNIKSEVQINRGGTITYFSIRDSAEGGQFILGEPSDINLYNVCLADIDSDGDLDIIHVGFPTLISFNETILTNIEQDNIPASISLAQNYPNPFNPSTTITYSIPVEGYIELKIFDVLGREIATLEKGEKDVGTHTITFNTKNYQSPLPSGVYFYTLFVKDQFSHLLTYKITRKMLLLK
jgi:hypothetical protein